MFQASERITAPLAALIVGQDMTNNIDINEVLSAKRNIRQSNRQRQEDNAKDIYEQSCLDLAEASSWLIALPLAEQGFHLHKGEFRDASDMGGLSRILLRTVTTTLQHHSLGSFS